MFKLALAASLLSALVSSVHGHGYVQEIASGSTKWTGYLPYSDPYYNPVPQRVVRTIPGNGPITDLSLIDVQCNEWSEGGVVGSAPAPIYATVAAGSKLALNWTTWPSSHVGPMITYMARAPSDITKWNPGTSAVWFKVAESGLSNGKWAATDLLTVSNSIYTFTIPPKLKAGQYIIRHEIIALHSAYAYPGAQVYPSCIQVQVTGSGTALPTSFVSFPGAYTASTPGIVFDAYKGATVRFCPWSCFSYTHRGSLQTYPIPGPAVWTGGN
ncbi:glycoside hydrolase family 61 protein [Lyophyllum atratum]|nr:glycoside hydrolase family 61 protein [Lyophyllum atratum]